MDPIPKKESHPVIEFADAEVVSQDGGRVYRTVLSYELESGETMSHNVDVQIEQGSDKPPFDRQIKALNVGIDTFHKKIRKRQREEKKEDPIRNV